MNYLHGQFQTCISWVSDGVTSHNTNVGNSSIYAVTQTEHSVRGTKLPSNVAILRTLQRLGSLAESQGMHVIHQNEEEAEKIEYTRVLHTK